MQATSGSGVRTHPSKSNLSDAGYAGPFAPVYRFGIAGHDNRTGTSNKRCARTIVFFFPAVVRQIFEEESAKFAGSEEESGFGERYAGGQFRAPLVPGRKI